MKHIQKKIKISIVIPVYNEEKGIPELVRQLTQFVQSLPKYDFEIIMVENGSKDTSFELLKRAAKKETKFKVIQLTKNVGADGGIMAGMKYASGDACVVLMADLQEPLEVIKVFISKWNDGYEIVYGIVRKRTASFARNVSSILFYKIINVLTGNIFPENASDFRLMDKKVYTAINAMPEHNKYLRGLIVWTGFKSIGVPFDRAHRFAGESKANFATVLKVAINGIFSFSYVPLRLVTILGISTSVISFGLIVFYLALFLIQGRVAPGVITIILLILLLFGILFFILGIISEYLARIYDEVKDRPSFIVKDKLNFD